MCIRDRVEGATSWSLPEAPPGQTSWRSIFGDPLSRPLAYFLRSFSPRVSPSVRSVVIKHVVAKLLCHPGVGHVIAQVYGRRIPFRGSRIAAPDDLVGGKQQAALFWNMYESAEARYIDRHLNRTLDVIDLGASIGAVSSLIRRRVAPERTVVSVEANPALAAVARENLSRNAQGAPFEVVNRAVDYTEGGQGVASFARRGFNLHGSLAGEQDADGETLDVPRTTVEALAKEFGFERYALVSDIEGAEAGFILGAPDTLDGCQQIIIELHETMWQGQLWTVDALVERLQTAGFQLAHRYGPVCHFLRP